MRAPVGKTGLGEAETRENQRKVNALRPSRHAANSLQRLFRGSEGDEWQYLFGYGHGPGTYTLQQPLDAPSDIVAGGGTFDFTSLVAYHLELDPGSTNGTPNSYNVNWTNLSAVNVPEPASLGIGALSCIFFVRQRRRSCRPLDGRS